MRVDTGKLLGGALAAAALSAAPLSAQARDGAVTIVVDGVRYAQGVVRAEVCTRDNFLTKACAYSGVTTAQVGSVTITIPSVPPGVYAIQAFHDANNNADVDQGVFGLPKEDIGFSNNVTVRLHAPSFDKASFVHGEAPQTIELHLKHFIGR